MLGKALLGHDTEKSSLYMSRLGGGTQDWHGVRKMSYNNWGIWEESYYILTEGWASQRKKDNCLWRVSCVLWSCLYPASSKPFSSQSQWLLCQNPASETWALWKNLSVQCEPHPKAWSCLPYSNKKKHEQQISASLHPHSCSSELSLQYQNLLWLFKVIKKLVTYKFLKISH